jgi:prolyl oligopeptidase
MRHLSLRTKLRALIHHEPRMGEYGSVSIPEQRAFLASISPYNQLRPDVNYPEPLIYPTTKDDRVGPSTRGSSRRKWKNSGSRSFTTRRGHSAGADLKERARTLAVEFTYLTRKLME